jgi:hypothetical protein
MNGPSVMGESEGENKTVLINNKPKTHKIEKEFFIMNLVFFYRFPCLDYLFVYRKIHVIFFMCSNNFLAEFVLLHKLIRLDA